MKVGPKPILRLSSVKEENQLCWTCANACGGCSWADSGEPVDGWEAYPSKLSQVPETFMIVNCPSYVKETIEQKKAIGSRDPMAFLTEGTDLDPVKSVWIAVIIQAVRDLARSLVRLKAKADLLQGENILADPDYRHAVECEEFFRSEWCAMILEALNIRYSGERFIKRIHEDPEFLSQIKRDSAMSKQRYDEYYGGNGGDWSEAK